MIRAFVRIAAQLLLVCALLSLPLIAGCGSTTASGSGSGGGSSSSEPNNCKSTHVTSPAPPAPIANVSISAVSGTVRAGAVPMVGATVQIYAAGAAGNGSMPAALLGAPLTSDATGSFATTGSLVCPYSNSVVYLVARGGSPAASGAPNTASALAAVLGPCSSLQTSHSIIVDEATTIATAWAMAPFLAAGGQIGATATNSSGINLAAAAAENLVNNATGRAPGVSFPSSGTAPVAKINAIANALNACVASSSAASSACMQLFAAATLNAPAPANTLDAAMNVARAPAANAAAISAVSALSTAYSPSLASAPGDWTLPATYTGGGLNAPTALSIDSQGNVWVANYFGVASLFANTGTPLIPAGISGNGLMNSYGGAVDVNDTLWIASEQSSSTINNALGSVTLLNSSGSPQAQYTTGGLNFPIAVAFDTSGVAWIVDYGDSHMTLLDAAGSPLSGASGYTSPELQFPSAIATDSRCNAFVANQSSNTVTRVLADGSSFTSFIVGEGPASVAVDSAGNVWSANFYANNVGLISSSDAVLSGSGYTGGGLNAPRAVAVDGNGNAWVASEHGATLAEFAAASSASPGALLSPPAGLGADANLAEPYALAIDAAGNIWVSNYGSNSLTEFFGLAAPVKTPLLGPVRVP
jgi:streptogramin lyase